MTAYTVPISPMDLTPRHIGQRARYSAHTSDENIIHEGVVNNIRFYTEQIVNGGGKTLRHYITAEVLIGDEWYPLTHVRFAETDTPWGKGSS